MNRSNAPFKKIWPYLTDGAAVWVWALLYPDKLSHPFYLGLAVLTGLTAIAQAWRRTSAVSTPQSGLFIFTAALLAAAAFSPFPWKSLQAAADVLLVTLFAALSPLAVAPRFIGFLAFLLDIAAGINLAGFLHHPHAAQISVLFANPILQGVAAGAGTVLHLQLLLEGNRRRHAIGLLLNAGALLTTGSKAAFLGTVLVAAYVLLRSGRKRILLPAALALALLVTLVPNPLRNRFLHTIAHDPYALDRISIWKMSWRMWLDHPLTGVGPDMFEQAARRYNFPQTHGTSRYGKIPETPHSDYLKIAVECGLPGILLLAAFAWAIGRRLLRRDGPQAEKILLLFLLFQSVLFNYIFQPVFLALVLTLCRRMLPAPAEAAPVTALRRWWPAVLLPLLTLQFYLLPWWSQQALTAAAQAPLPQRLETLQRAGRLTPLDSRPAGELGALLSEYYRVRLDPTALHHALQLLRTAQRRDRGEARWYLMEGRLLAQQVQRGKVYQGLTEEIFTAYDKAQSCEPKNPFLRLEQAQLHWMLGDGTAACRAAAAAVELEPEYVAAIWFQHRHCASMGDETALRRRLEAISHRHQAALPGSYLYELSRLPEIF